MFQVVRIHLLTRGYGNEKLLHAAGFSLNGAGCAGSSHIETETSGNPTAEEILDSDHDADIFQFNDLIYSNVEWAQEEGLGKGEKASEITQITSKSKAFRDGTANKLPVGANIYHTTEGGSYYLIVEHDGEETVYIALVEG